MIGLCNAAYFRPRAADPILCHSPANHPERDHSWEGLRRADNTRLEPVYPDVPDQPLKVNEPLRLLQAIERGDWDRYLEDVLEAAHRRKRLNREARHGRRVS